MASGNRNEFRAADHRGRARMAESDEASELRGAKKSGERHA